MKPEQIVKSLRKNGGKLATAAADCIEDLLAQTPEPKPRGGIHPHHEAIVLLFRTRLNKPQRDRKEVAAFKSIQQQVTDEDLQYLKRFYAQPEPKGYHKIFSQRKKTPITLMRNYVDQVDLAAEWCERNPPAPARIAPKFPEPKGWQAHAPGALGNYSWDHMCKHYPDYAKDISEAIKADCTTD